MSACILVAGESSASRCGDKVICVRADIPLLFLLQLFLAQQCLDHSAGSWTLEHFLISMCHTSILATYYSNQIREQLTVVSQVTELCKPNCDKNSSKGITLGTKVSNKIWEIFREVTRARRD